MAHEAVIDLAGYAPTDFAERAEPRPTVPQRMGACVTRSGLQGFASRSDCPEPVRRRQAGARLIQPVRSFPRQKDHAP